MGGGVGGGGWGGRWVGVWGGEVGEVGGVRGYIVFTLLRWEAGFQWGGFGRVGRWGGGFRGGGGDTGAPLGAPVPPPPWGGGVRVRVQG